MTQNTSSIATRALLVNLGINTWAARKADKKVTQEVIARHGTSSDAGKWIKQLFPGDSPAYDALMTLAGAIRTEHYKRTLPWSDKGWRVLASDQFAAYSQWVREQSILVERALALFIAELPAMQKRAEVLLNGTYSADDYPSAEKLQQRFSVEVKYQPIPTDTGDLRVTLATDQIEEIEAALKSQMSLGIQTAVADAWSRLYTAVHAMSEKLADPKGIFRDTLTQNIADVCATLAVLNITNDPGLEAMRIKVQDLLTRTAPQVLRDSPRVRANVAADAQAILDEMASVYGVNN